MFRDLIGKSMEVYVDDLLVKSKEEADHLRHLSEAFAVLRRFQMKLNLTKCSFGVLKRFQMKLNPTKCAFGVSSEKFLGHLVSRSGIEANPEKI